MELGRGPAAPVFAQALVDGLGVDPGPIIIEMGIVNIPFIDLLPLGVVSHVGAHIDYG